MLGRRPSARSRTVRNMLVDELLAFGDRRRRRDRPRRALDASQLHPQAGEHLRDVVVQLAREVLALFFLRADQLLRQLAHLVFGLFGSPLFERRARRAATTDERDPQAEQDASARAAVQIGAERRVPPRHFRPLRGEIGVVQLLDLLRDGQHRFAPGTTSLRRKPALWTIFSAGVQSNSGSNVCQ